MTSAYGSAFVAAAVAAALLGGGSERAAAQSYPQHPITLIAATAPGGPGDTAGRVIADKMSAILGQPDHRRKRFRRRRRDRRHAGGAGDALTAKPC